MTTSKRRRISERVVLNNYWTWQIFTLFFLFLHPMLMSCSSKDTDADLSPPVPPARCLQSTSYCTSSVVLWAVPSHHVPSVCCVLPAVWLCSDTDTLRLSSPFLLYTVQYLLLALLDVGFRAIFLARAIEHLIPCAFLTPFGATKKRLFQSKMIF